jgi:hypothetical protein
MPDRDRKCAATAHNTAMKKGQALCRADGTRRVVQSRRSREAFIKVTNPSTPIPNPPSLLVTEAYENPKVTATREMARPRKSEAKTTVVPKLAAGKSEKKPEASVKTAAAKPSTPNLLVQNQSYTSPLQEISVSSNTFTSMHVCS